MTYFLHLSKRGAADIAWKLLLALGMTKGVHDTCKQQQQGNGYKLPF